MDKADAKESDSAFYPYQGRVIGTKSSYKMALPFVPISD